MKIAPQRKYTISDGITQSMLGSFLSCRQRSRFQLDRWEWIGSDGIYINGGNFFHYLLENWYNDPDLRSGDAGLFVQTMRKDFIKKLLKKGPADLATYEDAFAFGQAVFPEYAKRWERSDGKYQWESLEEVFDIKWNGFRLRGKYDGVFTTSKRWLFETKTKSQVDEEGIMDSLAFDFQNLFYLTTLQALGRPAIGVVYNVIRKPSLRQKEGETTEQFTERTIADIKTERPDHYFKRYEVAYSQQTLARFQEELKYKLTDFELWVRGAAPTYRNEGACIGRTKCPYLKACASGTMVGYKQSRVLFRELHDG